MFWKRKAKTAFDENIYWQRLFGKSKDYILKEHKRTIDNKSESMLEKMYKQICSSIDDERAKQWILIKYHYTIQAFIIGGFVFFFAKFYATMKMEGHVDEIWILLIIAIVGIIYCISLTCSYYHYCNFIANAYAYQILIEPHTVGRYYYQQYKSSTKLYYHWEIFTLCLLVPLWSAIILFLVGVKDVFQGMVISVFVVEIVILALFFLGIPIAISQLADIKIKNLRKHLDDTVKTDKNVQK